jgi:hypothetical protein
LPRGPERAAALVAVQATVAALGPAGCDAGLSSPRDTHHEDDLAATRPRGRPSRANEASGGEALRERGPGVGVEDQARGRGGRARPLRRSGARERDDVACEPDDPGERDLGRAHAERLRDAGEGGIAAESARTARAAERRVGQHRHALLDATRDEPAAQGGVVEGPERRLDRRDGQGGERLVELAAGDVRQPDAGDEPLRQQPREGPQRRGEGVRGSGACRT